MLTVLPFIVISIPCGEIGRIGGLAGEALGLGFQFLVVRLGVFSIHV